MDMLINWLPDLHNLRNYILRPLTLIKSGLRLRTFRADEISLLMTHTPAGLPA